MVQAGQVDWPHLHRPRNAEVECSSTHYLSTHVNLAREISGRGGAWDAGRTVVTGTVDSVVSGTSTVVSSVTEDVVDVVAFTGDTAAGLVASTSEYIDKETDELQEEEQCLCRIDALAVPGRLVENALHGLGVLAGVDRRVR